MGKNPLEKEIAARLGDEQAAAIMKEIAPIVKDKLFKNRLKPDRAADIIAKIAKTKPDARAIGIEFAQQLLRELKSNPP